MCEPFINVNYVYLLQEREFIKTKENIYKIGMTKQENLERFHQYPKSSVLLLQTICKDCKKIETLVLKKFKETFKQRKDIGNEYFEGNYNTMMKIINSIVENETCDNVKNEDIPQTSKDNDNQTLQEDNSETTEDDNSETAEDDNAETQEEDNNETQEEDNNETQEDYNKTQEENNFKILKTTFPDYENDISFGGKKKFIKFIQTENEKDIIVQQINPLLQSYNNKVDLKNIYFDVIREYPIEFRGPDEDGFNSFKKLKKKKIIVFNKIYDLNDNDFIKEIQNTKTKITLHNYTEFIDEHEIVDNNKFDLLIFRILCNNAILNEETYGTIYSEDKTKQNFSTISIAIYKDYGYKTFILYKINEKYYDRVSFLRKYIPYLIKWDANKNYFIVNRDYKFIGINNQCIDHEFSGSCYLFNDGCQPLENEKKYIDYCLKYNKCISENRLNECLNYHRNSYDVLHLLD